MKNYKPDTIHQVRMSISKYNDLGLTFKKTFYARVLSFEKEINKRTTFVEIHTIQQYKIKKNIKNIDEKIEWCRKFNGYYYIKVIRRITIMDLHILYKNMNLFCDDIKQLMEKKL